MNREEALKVLGDGHTIWSVECAQEVCENIGVSWSDSVARKHYSYVNPGSSQKHNVYMDTEGEVTVACNTLTSYVMDQLGVEPQHYFHGRGSQAEHNARVIKEELDRRERYPLSN
jgi:hypothetical protein